MPDFPYDSIDSSWTLFLDRDGVLNRRIIDGYVRHPDEFTLLPKVPEALQVAAEVFGRMIVVTNQRGIARGLMTEADLAEVHAHFRKELEAQGIELDAIYHCPHNRGEACGCRKPAPGMALQAQQDFPEIDFQKSVMVGDSPSDMAMARKLGIWAVGVDPTGEALPDCDLRVESLWVWARHWA